MAKKTTTPKILSKETKKNLASSFKPTVKGKALVNKAPLKKTTPKQVKIRNTMPKVIQEKAPVTAKEPNLTLNMPRIPSTSSTTLPTIKKGRGRPAKKTKTAVVKPARIKRKGASNLSQKRIEKIKQKAVPNVTSNQLHLLNEKQQHDILDSAAKGIKNVGLDSGVKEIEVLADKMQDKLGTVNTPPVYVDLNSLKKTLETGNKKIFKYLKDFIEESKAVKVDVPTPVINTESSKKKAVLVKSPFIKKQNALTAYRNNFALSRTQNTLKNIATLPDLVPYKSNRVNLTNGLLSVFILPITDTYLQEIQQLYEAFEMPMTKGDLKAFELIHELTIAHKGSILVKSREMAYFMLFQNSVKHALLTLQNNVLLKKINYPNLSPLYNFKTFVSCIRDNTKLLTQEQMRAIADANYSEEMLTLEEYVTPIEITETFIPLKTPTAVRGFQDYFKQCIAFLYHLEYQK